MLSKVSSLLKEGDIVRVVKDTVFDDYNNKIVKIIKVFSEEDSSHYDFFGEFTYNDEIIEDSFHYSEVELVFSI